MGPFPFRNIYRSSTVLPPFSRFYKILHNLMAERAGQVSTVHPPFSGFQPYTG